MSTWSAESLTWGTLLRERPPGHHWSPRLLSTNRVAAMRLLNERRVSGALLIAAFVLHLGGVVLFNGREFLNWFDGTPTLFAWERGLLIAAYGAAALGVAVLESALHQTVRAVLGRLAAAGFLMAAVLAIIAEASFLSGTAGQTALVVVMVIALLLAEAILGWSLIGSGVASPWVGWVVLVWNLGWLAVLVAAVPDDLYYPILHFLPMLLIGIGLVSQAYTRPHFGEDLSR